MTSGGSPLEKVATIWASSTGAPQSSASLTMSVSGQPAGAAKLFTRPVWVNESRPGEHPGQTFRRVGLDVVASAVALRLRGDEHEVGEDAGTAAPAAGELMALAGAS